MPCADEIKDSAVATPIVEPSSDIPSGNPLANPQADGLPAPPEPSADVDKENEITVSLSRHHEVCPGPLCADAVIFVAVFAQCHMSVRDPDENSFCCKPYEIIADISAKRHLVLAPCACPY